MTEQLVYQLSRIGNNLNQLTKRVNSGFPVERRELRAVLQAIRHRIREL